MENHEADAATNSGPRTALASPTRFDASSRYAETAGDLAHLYSRWLKKHERNRWVIEMQKAEVVGMTFYDFGTGLPDRSHSILPFGLEAFDAAGNSIGEITKFSHLRAAIAKATGGTVTSGETATPAAAT